jgi:hypothetical protein
MCGSVAQSPRARPRFHRIFIGASRADHRAPIDWSDNRTRGATMSRIYVTLAAAAASALATAAIVALPAIGDDTNKGVDSNDDIAGFMACLREQGLDAPADADEFKPWLARQESRDPSGTKAAARACQAHLPKPVEAAIPDEFLACVRAQGLDAPTQPPAFDRWLKRLEETNPDALDTILPDCKRAVDPGPKPGDCAAAPPEEKAAAVDARKRAGATPPPAPST